jgi:hypothetical protein
MTGDRDATFGEMCRELPVETGLFSFGPVVIALALTWNGVYHGTAPVFHALFGVVMMSFAVLVTRYNLVAFRLRRLEE